MGRPWRYLVGALVLFAAAFGIWLLAELGAYGVDCPNDRGSEDYGLDTQTMVWPPGKRCLRSDARAPSEVYNAPDSAYYSRELVPGTRWLILAVALSGVVVIVGGVATDIRRLRRPAERPSN